ncbi:MAG: glycosyltransferase family 2 protein [Mesorhizobium sp.]
MLEFVFLLKRRSSKGMIFRIGRWIDTRSAMPTASAGKAIFKATDVSISGLSFETSTAPLVSIIITAFGGLAQTLHCLRSIAANLPLVPIELIVIEDASGDPEMAVLGSIPGLRFRALEENLGYVRACNIGAAMARGEFLHFLNNDTAVSAGWLDAMLSLFGRPQCGAVGSRLLNADGSLQEAGSVVSRDGSAWNFGRADHASLSDYTYVREVDYCSAASLLVRRDVFMALHGFDEAFAPAYYEDTDFAFRLRERGLSSFYQPKSVIYHLERFSHGGNPDSGTRSLLRVNQKKFVARWGQVLAREHFNAGEFMFLARQRAALRKIVLVVARPKPPLDTERGSVRLLRIVEALTEHGLLVKFWPHGAMPERPHVESLEQQGVEFFHSWRHQNQLGRWLRQNGECIDFALLVGAAASPSMVKSIRSASAAQVLTFDGRTDLLGQGDHKDALPVDDFSKAQLWQILSRSIDAQPYRSIAERFDPARMGKRALRQGWGQAHFGAADAMRGEPPE